MYVLRNAHILRGRFHWASRSWASDLDWFLGGVVFRSLTTSDNARKIVQFGKGFKPVQSKFITALTYLVMARTLTTMNFLEKIHDAMLARGMTQGALERAAKLPAGRISKWKQTKRNEIALGQALAVARVLGIPLDSLADPDAPWPPRPGPSLSYDQQVILTLAEDLGYPVARRLLLTAGREAMLGDFSFGGRRQTHGADTAGSVDGDPPAG